MNQAMLQILTAITLISLGSVLIRNYIPGAENITPEMHVAMNFVIFGVTFVTGILWIIDAIKK